MKKHILLFIVLFQCFTVSAQKAAIHLNFSAAMGTVYRQLDSIKIENMDQGGDTMLYWNDTTLSLIFSITGIQAGSDVDEGIRVIYPQNPESPMVLRISNINGLRTEINVVDLLGRIHCQAETEPVPGVYQFNLFPGNQAVYLVTASSGSTFQSIKIVNPAAKHSYRCFFSSSAFEPFPNQKPMLKPLSNFPYNPGDSLRFTGYSVNQQQIILDDPAISESYVFQYNNQPCPGMPSFTYGGQLYHTVKIGTQCWMRENLNIGTMVTSYFSGFSHSNCNNNGVIEKYCYNNDSANCVIYGGLYDWDEMMQYTSSSGVQGICPVGWHIPSDTEWCIMTTYLDTAVICSNPYGYSGVNVGVKMKESGFTHWSSPNTGATNESGFTAIGAGFRRFIGNFDDLTTYTYFWSSSEVFSLGAMCRWLFFYGLGINRYEAYKTDGYSVRCVLD